MLNFLGSEGTLTNLGMDQPFLTGTDDFSDLPGDVLDMTKALLKGMEFIN